MNTEGARDKKGLFLGLPVARSTTAIIECRMDLPREPAAIPPVARQEAATRPPSQVSALPGITPEEIHEHVASKIAFRLESTGIC